MADLIDRQAAIKAIEDMQDCYNGFSDTYDKACIIGMLEELPSAQRTGRWIGRELGYCTCCGHEGCASDIWDGCKDGMFCPNCGARMEVGE